MSDPLWHEMAWPGAALGEAVVALAEAAGLDPRPVASIAVAGTTDARRLEHAADQAGIEAEPVECTYAELAATLKRLGPALLRVPSEGGDVWLAVLGATRGALRVLDGAREVRRVPMAVVSGALTAERERELAPRVEVWLDAGGVRGRKRARARTALLRHFLADRRVAEMWLLRADAGSSTWAELRRRGALGRAAWFCAAALAQVITGVAGWALVGRAAMTGVVDPGWMTTWALLSVSGVGLQHLCTRLAGRLAVDAAALIKRRLLVGALRLDPDAVRAEGSGRLLAVVSESAAIEGAGLSGALGAAVAMVQLVSAAVVLALGASGPLHVGLLIIWSLLVAAATVRFHRRRAAWTAQRLALTNDFVENVVGNRTRVVQQPEADWHRLEDALVSRQVQASEAMDGASLQLAALPARGWLLVGFLGLVPAVLGHADTTRLAISVGGVLQAQAAFAALVGSATALVGAHVAWRSIGKLFRAAADRPAPAIAALQAPASDGVASAGAEVVLDVRDVAFRYAPGAEPVLRDCSLEVRRGDRLLVEGGSGGGKSTLASLLVGQRTPERGHILLRGLDAASLGSTGWRQRVASAPQYCDNHILSGTLAFNLLMGRCWPASDADRAEAEQVCRALGLGRLLDRMPAGLDQVVGETGWQLSHGERSRIFLARALLQRAEVVVLDETFAAIDPLTLRACVETALARAPSLVVIAHP